MSCQRIDFANLLEYIVTNNHPKYVQFGKIKNLIWGPHSELLSIS